MVAPAWEQARVVAGRLTGADPSARYTGSPPVARLTAAGVDLAAMGEALVDDDEAEVVLFADPHRGTYKKLVVRDHRLVGAILLGDADTVGIVTQFFDRQSPIPPDRKSLLFSRLGADALASTPASLPDHATVCHCNGVSKAAVRRCWLAGARGVGDVADSTRATTGCGTCRSLVQGVMESFGPADDLGPRGDRPMAHEAQRYA
jgi:assimilatory nitrate reductase electron transfer subunit